MRQIEEEVAAYAANYSHFMVATGLSSCIVLMGYLWYYFLIFFLFANTVNIHAEFDRVANFGQVFTRSDVVSKMLSLRKNIGGRILEPSAGDGAFSSELPGCVAVEIDSTVAPQGAINIDFFLYPDTERFDTIIGNPPYVRHQDILPGTKALLDLRLFDGRSNLYLFFIEKCVRHLNDGGELIFITPRDFIKQTAARGLNRWLFEQGTITDFIETGDSSIFGAYVPNCAIFRFEKGLFDRRMADGRIFSESDGQLLFTRTNYSLPLSSLFDVRVGAVSGADEVFEHPEGNYEFVCSRTIDSGAVRRMFFGVQHGHLLSHKQRLLSRKVRQFSERNWWEWGRSHHVSDGPRIYVNAKTRRARPFFLHDCKNYDGSILALFPKRLMDINQAVQLLNESAPWEELGFVCDGRFLFSQKALQNTMLPDLFGDLV